MNLKNTKSQLSIYSLCRNKEDKQNLLDFYKKNNLPSIQILTKLDLFQYVNKIIKTCATDYALLLHDDVFPPLNIIYNANKAIDKANKEFGNSNWGILGNAGNEFLTEDPVRFISDPHDKTLPSHSVNPIPVISIDGNTLLLNIKNLREHNVLLPKYLNGFQLYDYILLLECYKKGLICAVDSSLYLVHKSGGDKKKYIKATNLQNYQDYFKKNFVNHTFVTLNGLLKIKDVNLDFLDKNNDDKRKNIYEIFEKVILGLYDKKYKKEINIIVRTQLNRNNHLFRLLDTISISKNYYSNCIINVFLSIPIDQNTNIINQITEKYKNLHLRIVLSDLNSKIKSRVYLLANPLDKIKNKNSFIWYIDDDDFLYPQFFKYSNYCLSNHHLTVGICDYFEEKWNNDHSFPLSSKHIDRVYGSNYYLSFQGTNLIPNSGIIFPYQSIKFVFDNYKLLGNYNEDYAIFLLAQNNYNIKYYPILFTGISYHGKNTVINPDFDAWNFDYSTFMSEVINNGKLVNSTLYNLSKNNKQNVNRLYKELHDIKKQLNKIQNSRTFRLWQSYCKVRKTIFGN